MHLKDGSIQATVAGRSPARIRTLARNGRRVLSAFLVSALFWALPAAAQTSAALQDTTCAGTRDGGSLNCTAGEFTVDAAVQEATGTLPTCTIGGTAELDINVHLIGSNTDRQDAGFFVGQTGNDPKIANTGLCSVATFPTSPTPFKNNDGDACGDFAGGGDAILQVTAVKIACIFGTDPNVPATYGKLLLPYTLTYWQNNGAVCTGPDTVTIGSKSKCNSGVGSVAGVNLQGFVDITKQTVPDGDPTGFNFTTTGTAPFDPITDGNFTLSDGQTHRIETLVDVTTKTITVTEASTVGWNDAAVITCVDYLGAPVGASVVINGALRTFTASLDLAHPAVSCVINNTKGVPLSVSKSWVNGKIGDTATLTTTGAAANLNFLSTVDVGTEVDSATPIIVTSGNVITLAETIGAGAGVNYTSSLSCTGNVNALNGNVLTVGPSDTGITCTWLNTRKAATLTVAKSWSNGVVGDSVDISTTGGLNNVSFQPTSTQPTQIQTDPTTYNVFSGDALTFSELFITGLPGDYVTSLGCTGTGGSLAGNVLTVGPTATAITCTYTNSRSPVNLTIRKSWVNAKVNDAVTVSTVGGINTASLPSTANTATEIDTAAAPIQVFAGEQIIVGETFNTGDPNTYNSSLACTGNATPVSGAQLTVTAGDTNIVCTETNSRKAATLTLAKSWVNGAVGSSVTINGTGAINALTLNSVATGGNQTTTGSPIAVFVGEQVSLAEVFNSADQANYTSGLACTGNGTVLAGNVLTVNAADTAITCTFTNTRASGSLTLAKTWVNASIGETAALSGSGGANAASLNSTAGTANETDTGTPVTVSAGEQITLTELIGAGHGGNYVQALACTGGTLTGNVLTIGATPGSITCTFTNTRAAGTLTLAKTWVNAHVGDTAAVTGTGGANPASLNSTANTAGETDTSGQFTVSTGEIITIAETIGAGAGVNYNSSLACTGLGNGTTLVGNVLTIGASPGAIVCTETNSRKSATLVLTKRWTNAAVNDAVTVNGNSTQSGAHSLASVANTATEVDTGSAFQVFAGEAIAFSENFTTGSQANYSSSLACSGNGTALAGSSLTINPADTAISCGYTNARISSSLTVRKTWVNAVINDAVSVTTTGAVNNASLASVADTASETDTGTSVNVFAGEAITISEAFTTGSSANYTSSLACTGNTTPLAGSVLTVSPGDEGIVCTETNTRRATSLTLRKTWVSAIVGNAVTVSTTGATNNASLASVAGTANETDTGTPVNVFAGETISIAEAFTTGASGNYTSVLACTGNTTPLAGSVLTVTAGDGAIVCTETNTRQSATLTLRKTWVSAIVGNAVTVSTTGAINNASLASTADTANETDTGTPVNVFAGESISISEAFTSGASANYISTLSCTGNTTPMEGSMLTVTAGDGAIVCTETNSRRTATLTLRKTWVSAVVGDAVTVSATGSTNNPSLASVAGSANETDTGTPANVFAGEAITISEAFTTGSAAGYTAVLSCTGNTTPLASGVLTIDAADTAVVCTETNTRILFPILTVTKTATPTTFIIGQPATYIITVTNGGTGPTTGNFTIADNLAAGISLVSATGANWSCTGTTTLTCTFAGTLAVGASTTLTLNVAVANTATTGNNSATATGGGDATCPAAGHCTGTVQVPIQPPGPSLSIVKSASPVRVNAGSLVLYTLTITNIVNYDVVDAQVRDMPPNGLAFVVGSGRIYDANPANNAVSGARPIVFSGVDVAHGQTIRIQYLLRAGAALAAGEYTNYAQAFKLGQPISNIASFTVYAETGADPLLEQTRILGKVFDDKNGNGWQDDGERGVPGVRIAGVNGLVSETDAYGRYHQEGIVLPNQERGMNYVLKLDKATLPPGASITTENPLIRRITAAIPARFDFGVKLPAQAPMAASSEDVDLGEINFTPGSTEIRPEYQGVLDRIANDVKAHQAGEVFIDSATGNSPLAFERAGKVRDQIVERLSPEERANFTITVRLQAKDGTTGELGVSDEVSLGQVFFDTDKSTIRPEFESLLDSIAARIEAVGSGRVNIVGHADLRASTEYNQALGLRRANSVYDAIAKRLSPEARTKLSVEVEGAAQAPGAGQ